MPPKTELERLSVFARDFARLYARFLQHFSTLDAVTVESFAELFNASKVGHLHYSGGTSLERPFFPSITEDLLKLSSAYLSIPAAVAPRGARTFGLLLALFLYSNQPTRPHAAEADAVPGEAVAGAAVPTSPPLHRTADLPMRAIPISVSCMRQLLACMSAKTAQAGGRETPAVPLDRPAASLALDPPPLSYTEARVVLMLHRAGAWHVEPYVSDGDAITALLNSHATCGCPLVAAPSAAPLPPSTFAATLTARAIVNASAPPAAIGGTDSLFRDPEFVRLRQAYEKERQQLLR